MWTKYLIIIILFYFFAVMQNSFFAYFNLLGVVPNFVFILFFLLVFFEKKSNYYQIIFYATTAGLFLDIFSTAYFGTSIAVLLFLGFLTKQAQGILFEKKNNNSPFIYFLPFFIITLTVYDLLLGFMLNFWGFAAEIAYNLLFAGIAFYICKKFLKLGADDRQLSLFKP